RVLVALGLLSSSCPRELARPLGAPISGARKARAVLERENLVSGRLVGRTRFFRLNPAYFAREELEAYLVPLAAADSELKRRVESLRRRPRQGSKPL
ncbi:MAG: hypothetical protein ACREQY_14105, partial [Candidatus Binatia bacterium]